jgi:hypothetical protein
LGDRLCCHNLLATNLSSFIASLGAEKVVEASSVAERATSGYLRFDIWTQMLLSIQQHPLVVMAGVKPVWHSLLFSICIHRMNG